jgi:hypothetical protein
MHCCRSEDRVRVQHLECPGCLYEGLSKLGRRPTWPTIPRALRPADRGRRAA